MSGKVKKGNEIYVVMGFWTRESVLHTPRTLVVTTDAQCAHKVAKESLYDNVDISVWCNEKWKGSYENLDLFKKERM